LNKYRRCCILRKVRPLQIVTTSSFTELFSSLFLMEANLCWFFQKQTKVNSFETRWKHTSCIWGMNELLVQTRHKPARFLLFGGFLDKNCLKFSHLRIFGQKLSQVLTFEEELGFCRGNRAPQRSRICSVFLSVVHSPDAFCPFAP